MKFKVGDEVCVVSCDCEKYSKYRLNGKKGLVIDIHDDWSHPIAVKIEGIYNKRSSKGYFYFDECDLNLCNVTHHINMPKYNLHDKVIISDKYSIFYGCLGTVESIRRHSFTPSFTPTKYGILIYGFNGPLYFTEDRLSADDDVLSIIPEYPSYFIKDINNEIKQYFKQDIKFANGLETLVIREKESNMLKGKIEKVIFNDPATIVFWKDGTKTVVKAGSNPVDISNDCWNEDKFDPEKGLAMAIAKKALGNEGNYYNEFKKWFPEVDTNMHINKKEQHFKIGSKVKIINKRSKLNGFICVIERFDPSPYPNTTIAVIRDEYGVCHRININNLEIQDN